MLAAIFQEVKESGRIKDAGVFSDLSAQELRILKLIADGLTNREIAARLFLGEGTVRNYVSSVLSKLHLSNRAEAAAFAVQHNLKDHLKDSM
jgi:two-component system, NarL family, response regulator DevR